MWCGRCRNEKMRRRRHVEVMPTGDDRQKDTGYGISSITRGGSATATTTPKTTATTLDEVIWVVPGLASHPWSSGRLCRHSPRSRTRQADEATAECGLRGDFILSQYSSSSYKECLFVPRLPRRQSRDGRRETGRGQDVSLDDATKKSSVCMAPDPPEGSLQGCAPKARMTWSSTR